MTLNSRFLKVKFVVVHFSFMSRWFTKTNMYLCIYIMCVCVCVCIWCTCSVKRQLQCRYLRVFALASNHFGLYSDFFYLPVWRLVNCLFWSFIVFIVFFHSLVTSYVCTTKYDITSLSPAPKSYISFIMFPQLHFFFFFLSFW